MFVYDNDWVAAVSPDVLMLDPGDKSWMGNFTIRGIFVGFAKVKALLEPKEGSGHILTSSSVLKVSVIRKNSWMDRAFTISIAVLVSVLFVNFGAALDWMILKETLHRPIGPSIGFVTQFLFMPIVAYILGMVLFDSPSMRLGLFFTGCSPGA
ncbi:hypothetical protein J437_LFUL014422 [Ladona fulva]|uniref:Uncharacterized protein n=1 Tax=Ladona fulva TaxID=123851 RepID=A0A8K0KHP6_LADFU|nr:hypothetical protein J437_LFUL014422 [Ladona fulva]